MNYENSRRLALEEQIHEALDRELISASITMAHGLKLKVVAEGIETEEQLAFLKDLSCDYAQGYLFGKPLSETDFFCTTRID